MTDKKQTSGELGGGGIFDRLFNPTEHKKTVKANREQLYRLKEESQSNSLLADGPPTQEQKQINDTKKIAYNNKWIERLKQLISLKPTPAGRFSSEKPHYIPKYEIINNAINYFKQLRNEQKTFYHRVSRTYAVSGGLAYKNNVEAIGYLTAHEHYKLNSQFFISVDGKDFKLGKFIDYTNTGRICFMNDENDDIANSPIITEISINRFEKSEINGGTVVTNKLDENDVEFRIKVTENNEDITLKEIFQKAINRKIFIYTENQKYEGIITDYAETFNDFVKNLQNHMDKINEKKRILTVQQNNNTGNAGTGSSAQNNNAGNPGAETPPQKSNADNAGDNFQFSNMGGNRTHTNKRKNTRRGNKSMKGGEQNATCVGKLTILENGYNAEEAFKEAWLNCKPYYDDPSKLPTEKDQYCFDLRQKIELGYANADKIAKSYEICLEDSTRDKNGNEVKEQKKKYTDFINSEKYKVRQERLNTEDKKVEDAFLKKSSVGQAYDLWKEASKQNEERKKYIKAKEANEKKNTFLRSQSTNDINKPNKPSLFGRLTSYRSQSTNNTNTPVNSNPPPPKRYGWWGGTRPHTKKHPLKKHTNTRKNHRH